MDKTIIIFDIDETLTTKNLPIIIIESWIGNNWFKQLFNGLIVVLTQKVLIRPFSRRLEYFTIFFISKKYIENLIPNILENIKNVNPRVVSRLKKYQKYGYKIALVTAAPSKTTIPFANYFEVQSISSRILFGVLVKDLLGKKENIYCKIEKSGLNIRTVYSDSALDFWPKAKNILVERNEMKVIKK